MLRILWWLYVLWRSQRWLWDMH